MTPPRCPQRRWRCIKAVRNSHVRIRAVGRTVQKQSARILELLPQRFFSFIRVNKIIQPKTWHLKTTSFIPQRGNKGVHIQKALTFILQVGEGKKEFWSCMRTDQPANFDLCWLHYCKFFVCALMQYFVALPSKTLSLTICFINIYI